MSSKGLEKLKSLASMSIFPDWSKFMNDWADRFVDGDVCIEFVSIDGNIGAGKSYVLKLIKSTIGHFDILDNYHVLFVDEPVYKWLEPYNFKDDILEAYLDGKNDDDDDDCTLIPTNLISASTRVEDLKEILVQLDRGTFTDFNNDPKKYSFPFQITTFTTRVQEIIDQLHPLLENVFLGRLPSKPIVIICERFVKSDRDIFVLANVESGSMPLEMVAVYEKFYDMITCNLVKHLHTIVSLETNVDNCVKRIIDRMRKSENNIPIEYLELLEKYGNRMVDNFEGGENNRVIRVDNNGSKMQPQSDKILNLVQMIFDFPSPSPPPQQ